jgi:hypothetical protein
MASSDVTTLYLRGVSRRAAREAKAAAARAGKPLGRWVSEQIGLAAEAPVAATDSGSLDADLAWFEAHRSQLQRKYSGEYVAIVDQQVVDHDAQFDALATRVFARFGVRSVCMPRVARTVVHVRTPRRARK